MSPTTRSSSKTYSAFFYGTLMHPSILKRVIGHQGAQLKVCPALLPEYTRHHIEGVDYPGIAPYAKTRQLLFQGRELSREERCVRGTLVTGLSANDIRFLDTFEGDEYTRAPVAVYPLAPFIELTPSPTPLSSSSPSPPSTPPPTGTTSTSTSAASAAPLIVPTTPPPIPSEAELSQTKPIAAETYLWLALDMLEPRVWSYEEFVRNCSEHWIGVSAGTVSGDELLESHFIDVDRAREGGVGSGGVPPPGELLARDVQAAWARRG